MKRRMVIDGNKPVGETKIFESQSEMDLQHQVDALQKELQEVKAELESDRAYIARFLDLAKDFAKCGPPSGGYQPGIGCWGCDMSHSGYSSRGDGFHDDKCIVKRAQGYLKFGRAIEYASELTSLKQENERLKEMIYEALVSVENASCCACDDSTKEICLLCACGNSLRQALSQGGEDV